MSDITAIIDSYLDAYGEPDDDRRRRLLRETWQPDGTLIDPPMAASGYDGIDAMFVALQQQFPGHRFARTTEVDIHHGVARYGWALLGADGGVAVAGVDVAVVGDDGRLSSVTGFFGELVPLQQPVAVSN